ncbi:MAG: DUF4810 domain-containing protein [Chlorobiaceae bacterium]|jgi:hypothetical protein
MKKIFPVLLIILFMQGCASNKPTLYSWGNYQQLIYQSYANPGKISPEEQVLKLEADSQIAKSKNQALPPGFHAQMGGLYFQTGKLDQARQAFITEKELFPESKQFMDRLIAKTKNGGVL